MRALNIAIFIFILSLSLSTVRAVYGLPHRDLPFSISQDEVRDIGSVEEGGGLFGINMFRSIVNSIKFMVKIAGGAVMLGSTVQSMIPFRLPAIFVAGLNTLGAATVGIMLVQIVRGIELRGAE